MKKLILICAPVSSRSGYGAHARDLVSSFVENDAYDVKVQDVRWGDCPRDALKEDNPNHKKMMDCFLQGPTLERQPDIYIDIRIPHEFETHGKINIGITAGVETDAVSHKWLESCNKMDLVIVPSEHSKQGFASALYEKMQNLPDGQQQKVGELKLEKPMEVLFEGSDITNAGYEQAYYQQLSVETSGKEDVAAGKAILFTFRADDTDTTEYHISATIKYHLR